MFFGWPGAHMSSKCLTAMRPRRWEAKDPFLFVHSCGYDSILSCTGLGISLIIHQSQPRHTAKLKPPQESMVCIHLLVSFTPMRSRRWTVDFRSYWVKRPPKVNGWLQWVLEDSIESGHRLHSESEHNGQVWPCWEITLKQGPEKACLKRAPWAGLGRMCLPEHRVN